MKKTAKVFKQEGRLIDNTILAISDGILRPIVIGLVSILTKVIGICLKLFWLHSYFYYDRPILGLGCGLSIGLGYRFMIGRSMIVQLAQSLTPSLPLDPSSASSPLLLRLLRPIRWIYVSLMEDVLIDRREGLDPHPTAFDRSPSSGIKYLSTLKRSISSIVVWSLMGLMTLYFSLTIVSLIGSVRLLTFDSNRAR